MNLKNICINCMREKPSQDGICPYCGFHSQDYVPEEWQLPPMILLNGKYLLGKVLGTGGFGITYIAYDTRLQMPVAIKELFLKNISIRSLSSLSVVIPPSDLPLYEENKKRFLQEARILARFRENDNVVSVKDTFEENNTVYIVMEYLSGQTLKQRVRKAPLSCKEVKKLLGPVAGVLGKIHQQGVLHLDVSPDNIMILPNHKVKLLDFGGARIMAENQKKFAYRRCFTPMEQRDESGYLGPWTDEYALAATMYYCMTGEKPPDVSERIRSSWVSLSPARASRSEKALSPARASQSENALSPARASQSENALSPARASRSEPQLSRPGVSRSEPQLSRPGASRSDISLSPQGASQSDISLSPQGASQSDIPLSPHRGPSSETTSSSQAKDNPQALHDAEASNPNPQKSITVTHSRRIPGNVRKVLKKALSMNYADRYPGISDFWNAFCRAERQRKRTGLLTMMVSLLFTASIGTGILIGKIILPEVIIPAQTYASAEASLEEGKYVEAYQTFQTLDDYLDAGQRAEAILTSYAGYFLEKYDRITFGRYAQTKNRVKEPITWLVLQTDPENKRVLLISERALACHPFNFDDHADDVADMTWAESDLEKWLNQTFLENAFTLEEQSIIRPATLNAIENPTYRTSSGKETAEAVFVLSYEEAGMLFESDEKRVCKATAYAVKQGGETDEQGNCSWWLRTQGRYPWEASVVTAEGKLDDVGNSVGHESKCVRPALWIDMDEITEDMLTKSE